MGIIGFSVPKIFSVRFIASRSLIRMYSVFLVRGCFFSSPSHTGGREMLGCPKYDELTNQHPNTLLLDYCAVLP